MNWAEVNIYTTTVGIEPLCGVLMGIGINGFSIKDAEDFAEFLDGKTGHWDYVDDDLMSLKDCETCVTVYVADNAQGSDMLILIKNEVELLKSRDEEKNFGRLVIEIANVREEDWANNWKQYFKPITVGRKLVIKPSWEEYSGIGDGRLILEIDPASSFGTGQHNTTRLCMELLENSLNTGDTMLDVGCGSGILSIAAMLLGAKQVVAVDIKENSIATAIENAKKNNIFEDLYSAYCGNILTDEKLMEKLIAKVENGYDVITANIVADVLIAMKELFKKLLQSDGILIVSGIISERAEEVTNELISAGFCVREGCDKDGWSAISLIRSD